MTVLVRVLEPVLADGVPSDQALTSSRMSEMMSFGSDDVPGSARGTVIVSDLRAEDSDAEDVGRDSNLWGAASAMGEGRARGEGGAEG